MKRFVMMVWGWIILVLAVGCSTEGLPGQSDKEPEDGLIPVSFCLRQQPVVTVTATETKAEIDADTGVETENVAINNLTVLQFNWDGEGTGDETLCVTARYFRSPEPENGTKDTYSIGLRAERDNQIQYLIFIANAGAAFQNYEGKKLSEFYAETITPDQQTTNEDNVLMIAAVTTALNKQTESGSKPEPVEVNLQRLLARVRFTWEKNLKVTGTTFTPSVLKIGNVPNVLRYADGFLDSATRTDYPAKAPGNFKDYTSIVDGLEDGYTWYIPLNRHAQLGTGKEAYEKDGTHAPDNYCTYVELSGVYTTPNMSDQLVSYRFYPGGNTTNDYTIERNHAYDIHAVIYGVNSFDKRVTKKNFEYSNPANCYVIAPEAGNELSFNPFQSPGTDVAGTGVVYKDRMIEDRFSRIADVKIVWQTTADLIESVTLAQGMVNVVPNTDGTSGNALIAAYDDNTPANILWSWHIWVTPYEKVLYRGGTNGRLHEYAGLTWMDRNLGALSTIKREVSDSLYYQWGRKDPFVIPASGGETNASVADKGTALNIDESIENPTVFFKNQTSKNTWHGGESLPGLWQSAGSKTAFDPCPSGWRVPGKAAWETFLWKTNFSWDPSTDLGATRNVDGGELPAWYPMSERLDMTSMNEDKNYTYIWSASFGTKPYVFQFNSSTSSTMETSGAWGAAVRCVKE